eukprot:13585441-Ditylum_brightwellii.AAC.1
MGSSVFLLRSCAPPSTVLLFSKGGSSISKGDILQQSSISSPQSVVEIFLHPSAQPFDNC